jgi:hypothetical protein
MGRPLTGHRFMQQVLSDRYRLCASRNTDLQVISTGIEAGKTWNSILHIPSIQMRVNSLKLAENSLRYCTAIFNSVMYLVEYFLFLATLTNIYQLYKHEFRALGQN